MKIKFPIYLTSELAKLILNTKKEKITLSFDLGLTKKQIDLKWVKQEIGENILERVKGRVVHVYDGVNLFKLATFTKKGINNIVYNYKLISKSINAAIKMLSPNKRIGGHLFLLEIAMAESMLGTHPRTIRIGYSDRGPFQLNPVGFNETKHYSAHGSLKTYYKNLSKYGIDWLHTDIDMCNTALFGAIASRLLLLIDTNPIPKTLEGRATYWKKKYNSDMGHGDEPVYIERVKYCVNKLKEHNINLSKYYKPTNKYKLKDPYMIAKKTKHYA